MNYINRYLRNFEPYRVASHKIWAVDEKSRSSILKLDWNESTIEPSPKVKERLKKLIETDFLNYYPATYNCELYQKLSDYTELPIENIQYFASSDSLHEYIAKMFITVGDPVLIMWPSYDNFRLTAQVAGANLMFFEMDTDFCLDREKFKNEILDKEPSLVYICNPNNPTGQFIEKEYIEELLVQFPQTMFLIDEAYIEFSGGSCKNLVKHYDNILISRTMSKAFALANVRFGYLLASEKNIKYISSIRNPKNITTFTQEAVIGVLSDINYMKSYVSEVKKAKKMFINYMNNNFSDMIKIFPSEANFVLIRCINLDVKKQIIDYFENNDIFIRNVSQSKSVEQCLRITVGTSEQMEIVQKEFRNLFKN